MHNCIGGAFAMGALLASAKAIFKLNNLRRTPGRNGRFIRAVEDLGGLDGHIYLDEANNEAFCPISLSILYDAETIDSGSTPSVKAVPPTATYW